MLKLFLLIAIFASLHADEKSMQTWEEMSPIAVDKDWIELNTREWLRGEFVSLYSDRVIFRSDKLKKQTFKFKDVRQLIIHDKQVINIDNRAKVVGMLKLDKNEATITTNGIDVRVNRNQIISISISSDNELDLWKFAVKLGLNLTKGNSEKTDYSSRIDLVRRGATTRFTLNYNGNYSVADSVKTTDNTHINSSFDIFKTKQFYYQPFVGSYKSDIFQNLQYRYTVGVGIGYTLIDDGTMLLQISGGPEYQELEYASVEVNEDKRQSSPLFSMSNYFSYDITSNLDISWKYQFKYMNNDAGLYTHDMLTSLSYDLTKRIDMNFDLQWNRIENPKNYQDGTIPKRDDYITSIKFGVDY
ncbi:MAG: DUF481 domain-containing protein [Campylobacterota bacterium]|nr:DUF481 domain-containing protein [Campylobacterota bacterium]